MFFQNVSGIPAELANNLRLRNAEKALPARVIKSIEDKRSVLV
jgi:hypothetical protein